MSIAPPTATRTETCGACRHPIASHGMLASGELSGWVTCALCEADGAPGACSSRSIAAWRSF